MKGFLAAKGLNIECLGAFVEMGSCVQYNNLLNKFPKDRVFLNTGKQVCFLDGYVYNKDMIKSDKSIDWQTAFADAFLRDPEVCLCTLRGGFCGYSYNKLIDELIVYTDQLSVKAIYYYVNGDQWIVSNNFSFIIEVLKANGCKYDFNDTAARYMLTYGYMLDDSTFANQIHRLMPGYYVSIRGGKINRKRYHIIDNTEIQMTEQEAVERIDKAFRTAIAREFEKDLECGYQHLVDLSGGLDSRMVSWVAHDMGYTNQVNITYSRAEYKDEKIAKKIACYLKHEYLFMALDDAKWFYDVDKIILQNNGAALYTGITGGARMLESINGGDFGIEHTGMIGDAILSTFYSDRKLNYGKPQIGFHRYSDKLIYEFDKKIMKDYPCQEMFAIYTRGILGAQSSYVIRQHYFETASPFMDVDFLDTVFSIPFEYRRGHHIYMKWMLEKYPGSTEFGWEKWGGVKPKESYIFLRKLKTTQRLLYQMMCQILKLDNRDLMNPEEYWYRHDEDIQNFFGEYYNGNIERTVLEGQLKSDIEEMFLNGNVTEKSMVLTVLSIIKLYFS